MKTDFKIIKSSEIKRVLLHELLHAYEIYQRNHDNPGLQWKSLKKLQEIRVKYEDDLLIRDLITLIYWVLDHEMGSLVTQTYHILMEEQTSKENQLYKILSKSTSWNILKQIKNFQYQRYHIGYQRCLEFFQDYHNFMSFSDKKFKILKVPIHNIDIDQLLKEYSEFFQRKAKKLESKLIRLIQEVKSDVEKIQQTEISEHRLYNWDEFSKKLKPD